MGSVELHGVMHVPGKQRRIRLFTRQVLWLLDNAIVDKCPECGKKRVPFRGGEDGIAVCPFCDTYFPFHDSVDVTLRHRGNGEVISAIPSEEVLTPMGYEIK